MALTTIDDRGLKTPIDLLDNEKIRFGTGNDLEIFHDGSNNYLKTTTGHMFHDSQYNQYFRNQDGSETKAIFGTDGACVFYYDNSQKFETFSWGCRVHGNLSLIDDKIAYFGTGNDLQIYHDGNHSYLNHTGTGHLYMYGNGVNDIYIRAKSDENSIIAKTNGAVELYYDSVKKLSTDAHGVQIHDWRLQLNAAGEGEAAEMYFYADQGDDSGDCWRLSATNGDSGSGSFYLQGYPTSGLETFIRAGNNGPIELYYDNAKKFETTAYGAKISSNGSAGYLEVSTTGNLGDGHIEIKGGEGGGAVLSLTADEGDDNADYWRIQNAGDSKLAFRSKESGSWVEKFAITEAGALHPTDHVFMDAGYGIAFDPYGSGGANLLDDYEEGTFTPTIVGPGGTGTAGSNNAGFYTKVGNLVTCHGTLHWTALSGTTSGAAYLGGLPFTTKNVGNYRSGSVIGGQVIGVYWSGTDHAYINIGCDANQTFFYITAVDMSDHSAQNYTHTPNIASTGTLYGFTLTYHI